MRRLAEIFRRKYRHPSGNDLLRKHRLYQLYSDIDDLLDLALTAYKPQLRSYSQLKQDIFVLLETGFKKNGYFVEFGATNGIELSNSYLLETEFGWDGILAEPARSWHSELKRNRRAALEFNCVWSSSDKKLLFNEIAERELSTIADFNTSDSGFRRKNIKESYEVTTISLNDLLKKHGAPAKIDYLSIDTEGSEFDILSAFDFSRHEFRVITSEHNFTSNRQKVNELLTSNGYRRVLFGASRFDDWFVKD